ncbi:3-keto-disaccharide hydrolase [Hirschia litorea]|uniref:DUF1080 domain-containing protein n=1 Tax=Hirschia litorea TaxID=1199156 RepID=A0ABW2IP57_9PROT
MSKLFKMSFWQRFAVAGAPLVCATALSACVSAHSQEAHNVMERTAAPEACEAEQLGEDAQATGYRDTPLVPGTKWRVHDIDRPKPEVVGARAVSAAPPSDAIILLGDDMSAWRSVAGGDVDWSVSQGVATIPDDLQDDGQKKPDHKNSTIQTKQEFGDVQLHVEWRAPPERKSNSQWRGNSGIIFMGRYEVQVLDSHCNDTYADGQAASLYGWKPPLVNASVPAGQWQSYDIVFEAPRWNDAGELMKKARATVFHNGVLVQNAQPFLGKAAWRAVSNYDEVHGPKAPLHIQDHDSAVSFRNIWIRELNLKANN